MCNLMNVTLVFCCYNTGAWPKLLTPVRLLINIANPFYGNLLPNSDYWILVFYKCFG